MITKIDTRMNVLPEHLEKLSQTVHGDPFDALDANEWIRQMIDCSYVSNPDLNQHRRAEDINRFYHSSPDHQRDEIETWLGCYDRQGLPPVTAELVEKIRHDILTTIKSIIS